MKTFNELFNKQNIQNTIIIMLLAAILISFLPLTIIMFLILLVLTIEILRGIKAKNKDEHKKSFYKQQNNEPTNFFTRAEENVSREIKSINNNIKEGLTNGQNNSILGNNSFDRDNSLDKHTKKKRKPKTKKNN